MGSLFLTNLVLFAQAKGAKPPAGQPSFLIQMAPWLAIFALAYFLLIRPHRAEQAKRKAMLAAIKKNDRVITAGGIYGVVTNVRPDADEVTVKVDETNNTKLRMTLSSVTRVLGDETSDNSK